MNNKLQNFLHFTVRPLTGVLGAEIIGLDISKQLTNEAREELRKAFADHQVIVFPDQELSHEQHEDFAKNFGEVIPLQLLRNVEGHDNIQVIRRLATDTGRVVGENWHSDSTYLKVPPKAVVMRAVDIPDFGGDTSFLSMTAAYEALSPGFKNLISRLNVVHSGTRIFGSAYLNQDRRYEPSNVKLEQNVEEGDTEIIHPLVCVNEVNQKKFIFLSKNYTQRIDGLNTEESAFILNYLYEHCSKYEFTCRIRWKKNQIVVWDNRSTMHRAVFDYAGQNRLMTRVTVTGDRLKGVYDN